jgi:FkbM family methyltransferase
MLGSGRDNLILAAPGEAQRAERARHFCAEFCRPGGRPKYVLGRNVYTRSVAERVVLAGIIDDYADADRHLGLPVVRATDVPRDALVLNAAGGRPLTARRHLDALGLENLDYFAFLKWSGLPLAPVVFNDGFAQDHAAHAAEYEWIVGRVEDESSRLVLRKLISFRLKYDIELLDGFESRLEAQYFEDFLKLRTEGESFVDIGGYDGANSLEFIRRCPGYGVIHVFEPEAANYRACVATLAGRANVHVHQVGLAAAPGSVRLASSGSTARIADEGASIAVKRLDDVIHEVPTFIKMDVEGVEAAVIEGAGEIIRRHRPRLAICVYHNAGDFWRIPRQVLALRADYRIHVRHYTESIYETVMFFV